MKELIELHREYMKKNFPALPEHALPKYKNNDRTTNGLTKCIIDFLKYSGWQAERISTTGRWIQDKNEHGWRKPTGKWIPSSGTRGSADISATIKGRSVKIEIKRGKDKQSEVQKKYEQQITNAGGEYWLIYSYNEFRERYSDFCKRLSI
jgi:hypothetical protein